MCSMRAPPTHETSEGATTMNARPEFALFRTDPYLPGILKCAVCQELFQTAESLRSCIADLKARGKSTRCFPTPEGEHARRRQHAERHVEAGEATLDRMNGFFVLAEHLRPTPKVLTAADHRF